MSAFLKKGKWFLGEVVETGRNYKVLKIDGGDSRAPHARYGHIYRVPVLLSKELAKRGAKEVEDGFFIARNENGSFYVDADNENPGANGEDIWIRRAR